jgi:hypothetical protein
MGDGSGLTNLNADTLNGQLASSFARLDLSNTFTGTNTFEGQSTFEGTTTFDTAPGTAPFTVSSTTQVSNLNADILDGMDSSDFVKPRSDQTFTGINTFSNTGNSFTGTFSGTHRGDGTGLTNLNADNLASGTVSPVRGGTGTDTSAAPAGSILSKTPTGAWSTLSPGINGQVLKIIGGMPAWDTDLTGGGGSGGVVTYIASGSTDCPSGNFCAATANCDRGDVALGGGFQSLQARFFQVYLNAPVGLPEAFGWAVEIFNDGPTMKTLTAKAVCLDKTP